MRARVALLSTLIWIALLGSGCAGGGRLGPAGHGPYVHANAVNIAVLVLDYETLEFEGARVLYFPPCDPCADDSIPLSYRYKPPGDAGDITFWYTPTEGTVFFGTIIWMGTGRIIYPESFEPADHFARSGGRVPKCDNIRLFMLPIEPSEPPPVDAIWRSIDSLDLLKEFQSPSLRAGFYLYPPTVGVFDPGRAKWIVFLYRRA